MNRSAWLFTVFWLAIGALLAPGLGCQVDEGGFAGNAGGNGLAGASGGAAGTPTGTGAASGSPTAGSGGTSSTAGSGGMVSTAGSAGTGGSPCGTGLLSCPSGCVNGQTDLVNCGACGTACGQGQTCTASMCQCLAGLTKCGTACVNTLSDAANCGVCGTVCPAGQVCSNGACSVNCSGTQTKCGQSCVDLQTDGAHCGACSMACASGQSCSAGRCGCSGGLTLCNNQCVDTRTSASNCGTCGTTCSGGRTCNSGMCQCPTGQTYCGTSCVTTATDANNCGTCGTTCSGGRTCSGGMCQCPSGQTFCNNTACLNLQTDVNNCGTCGNRCQNGAMCMNGACMGGVMCMANNTTYNGRITTYNLSEPLVHCSYPTNTLPQYYGAMNQYDYALSATCGTCVEVTNTTNNRKLVVTIVDECPDEPPNEQWCSPGSHHIDLNRAAYDNLGAVNNPAITWRYVPCPVTGNLRYYFDPAAQQYYLAVMVTNHRYQLAKVEVMKDGSFQALTRRAHNMWDVTTGAGPGPFTFRVTDIHNHVVTDSNIPLRPGQFVDSAGQFATCN